MLVLSDGAWLMENQEVPHILFIDQFGRSWWFTCSLMQMKVSPKSNKLSYSTSWSHFTCGDEGISFVIIPHFAVIQRCFAGDSTFWTAHQLNHKKPNSRWI